MTYDLAIIPSPANAGEAAEPQYTLTKILLIWAAATLPMGILTWGVAPFFISRSDLEPGLIYWTTIIAGLIWQFALAVIVLLLEGQEWTWPALKRRLWLKTPRHPKSGRTDTGLFWMIVPGILFVLITSDWLGQVFDGPFQAMLPAAMMPAHADIQNLAKPELQGQWIYIWLAIVSCLFNYILGEALLFHGVLLPKMLGVFGRWAWLANAVLFGLYHVHLIWALPSIIISNIAYSLPAQRYRSVWLAVWIHGLEAIAVLVAISMIVYGLG